MRALSTADLGLVALESGAILRTSADVPRAFTIEALLGYGGMGAVYRARMEDGQLVALKVLHERFRGSSVVARRFAREARLAAQVDHPKVVRILDAGVSDDGAPFLVSELLEGETFDERARAAGGKLPLDEVLRCADELLDVLGTAHARGVVHRDIKPANLFRLASGELRVLDFGLAHEELEQAGQTQLTGDGSILGTAGFMAPELALGRWDLVDAQSDLWAVAATALHLATGQHVHDAHTPQEHLALAATRPPPPVTSRAPALPRPVAAWLDRGLAFSKRDRFESARTMRDALGSMVPEGQRVSKRPVVVAAVVLVALSIGGATVFARRAASRSEVEPGSASPELSTVPPAVAFSARLADSAAAVGSTDGGRSPSVTTRASSRSNPRAAPPPAASSSPPAPPAETPTVDPLDRRR